MTLDERIAKERKAVARHQKALGRGRRDGMTWERLESARMILAVLEKVKQLPGM